MCRSSIAVTIIIIIAVITILSLGNKLVSATGKGEVLERLDELRDVDIRELVVVVVVIVTVHRSSSSSRGGSAAAVVELLGLAGGEDGVGVGDADERDVGAELGVFLELAHEGLHVLLLLALLGLGDLGVVLLALEPLEGPDALAAGAAGAAEGLFDEEDVGEVLEGALADLGGGGVVLEVEGGVLEVVAVGEVAGLEEVAEVGADDEGVFVLAEVLGADDGGVGETVARLAALLVGGAADGAGGRGAAVAVGDGLELLAVDDVVALEARGGADAAEGVGPVGDAADVEAAQGERVEELEAGRDLGAQEDAALAKLAAARQDHEVVAADGRNLDEPRVLVAKDV